jgi:hypothetical protein
VNEPRYAIEPGDPIPERFIEVLATWPALRAHPAWKDNEQLAAFDQRLRLIGWRHGQKVFRPMDKNQRFVLNRKEVKNYEQESVI